MTRFAALGIDDPRTVAGYVLRARLGGGGMGQVYLSFSPGGRAVAVKVVRAELADDPEFRRRFRHEVEVAQQVHGLYTAPVLDADPDAPRPWLATAYIAGPTLQEAVVRHGRLPQPVVARLLAGCAEALASVHAAGLVHRDFKPGNVLLAQDGPRVIDFGIARAADAGTLTRSGVMVGTPAFMAPEQVVGREVTPATDVFALALTAYYAATGQSAFGDGNPTALAYRIVHEDPELDGCPPGLRPLLTRCLEKNPAGRPSTTEIMEQARALVPDEQLQAGTWLPSAIATTLAQYRPTMPPQAAPPHSATFQEADAQAPAATAPSVPAYGSAPPVPHALTTNLSMLRRDGTPRQPLLIAAAVGIAVFAVGVVALVALPKGHSSGETNNHGAPVADTGETTPASTGNASSASSSPTPYGGRFVQEYKDISFSLPGNSGVNFTDKGPSVTTDTPANLLADLRYDTLGEPGLARGGPFGIEMASSTGPADANACYDAVTRNPIDPPSYPSLKVGAVFCLTKSNQLTYIRLTGKRPNRLTWVATGWLTQSE